MRRRPAVSLANTRKTTVMMAMMTALPQQGIRAAVDIRDSAHDWRAA